MNDIVLIDAGTGNLRSVQKALESIGANVLRTDDPKKIQQGKRVVLPGVGAFGNFISGLRARKLEPVIKEMAERGIPMLGICVGMQALFEAGEELGTHAGLGLLAGNVMRFAQSLPVKVPHTGWNQLELQKDTFLFNGINSEAYVYFNHSYFCQARDPSDVLATTHYGIDFACAVERENIFGVQFHPEKSQAVGLRILKKLLRGSMSFTIYPAVDLRGGRVVRLKQGDPARMTAYSDDPAETARLYLTAGANWLHVVNLDGAFGESDVANRSSLRSILGVAKNLGAQVQFGGGMRSLDAVDQAIDLGVGRVVLGTIAVEKPDVVANALTRFGAERIAVGIDARDGLVRVRGWKDDSGISAMEFAFQMQSIGLRTVIFTDINQDGMGGGLNIAATAS